MNLDFSSSAGLPDSLPKEPARGDSSNNRRRTVACTSMSTQYEYRRGFSEARLLEAMKLEKFQQGQCWHFITAGDVDSLSLLKVVMLQQPKLEYLLFSTWCMAAEDILQFEQWLTDGNIQRLDCYVGEIFPNQYRVEWGMLRDMVRKTGCGRVAVFRNHSKIFAGWGADFHFTIESSANINTNPRTEQACITIDEGVCRFYKEYFDGIVSFVKD